MSARCLIGSQGRVMQSLSVRGVSVWCLLVTYGSNSAGSGRTAVRCQPAVRCERGLNQRSSNMSVRNRYRRYISTRTIGSQGRTVRSLSVRRAVGYEACRSVCVSARGLSVRVAVRCQRRGRRRIGTTGYRGRIAGVTARCLVVRSVCKSARSLVNQFRTLAS